MSGLEDSSQQAHRAAQEALPWLANGTLGGREAERLHAHLRACALCRDELELLRAVHAAGPLPGPGGDAERALARLLPQLEAGAADSMSPALAAPPVHALPPLPAMPASHAASPRLAASTQPPATALPPPAEAGPLARWRARLAANDRRWLRHAVAVQACLVAVLALLLLRPQPAAEDAYRGLGAATPVAASIVVVFRPDTPERELRRIVRDSGARLRGGPTAGDAWLLDGLDTRAVLARLRAEPAVVLAEPLVAEGRP